MMNFQNSHTTPQCVHQWFELTAAHRPNTVAVIDGTQQLSYQEVNEQANQLAKHIQALGVRPETLVGICVERSYHMVISMLAVLKAGGAYVPLDPSYPRERIDLMVEDSQIPVLITQKKLLGNFSDTVVTAVCIDADKQHISQECVQNLEVPISQNNLAYVIYTSGSTGKPKGVLIEHGSLSNFVDSMRHKYQVTAEDRVLQFASISFDVAVEEIFITLVQGATLILRSQEMLRSIPTFLKTCQAWNISILNLPTAFWHKLCGELSQVQIPSCVRLVVIGSERAIPQWLSVWKEHAPREVRLINAYGPTEATVGSTLCDLAGPNAVDVGNSRVLPIGQPIDNVQAYILDDELRPVEFGVAGELFIAGKGLARSYLNRPELTAERFIFVEHPEIGRIRLYKTGDRVRYRKDGHIEFLDRIDRQEKIRGFRIELSEIESVLEQHSSVQQAIVLAWEETPGNKRLVAYVVPHKDGKTESKLRSHSYKLMPRLRSYLQNKLPSYMVPSAFTLIDVLPLTPNGKIDRRALPSPSADRPALNEVFIPPLTPLEQRLAKMWSAVLSISEIGVNDNFFELGGDSLQTTQLIAQVEKDYKVVVQLLEFFSIPTIAGLAGVIQRIHSNRVRPTDHMDLQQLQAEVVVDENVQIVDTYMPSPVPVKNVFLTGATGFLGSFILSELLEQTQADIYCLVRADDLTHAHEKLRSVIALSRPDLIPLATRIIPVVGDLSQPQLGLDDSQWTYLSTCVEVIYHGGANVNLLYPYAALYPTNVQGSHEILKLASTKRTKPVHYLSTLDVFESLASTGTREFFEDADLAQGSGIVGGYAQSKWVAEQMMRRAAHRGLPVCIYRPGMVAGHSQSGYSNTSDILCRLLKSLEDLQQAPELDLMIDMTPVDYVSKTIISISMQPQAIGRTFHVVNPQPMPFSAIVNTMKDYGYAIDKVSYAEWQSELRTKPNALSPLVATIRSDDPNDKKTCLELWLGGNDRFDCKNTLRVLEGMSYDCPPADSNLLETYLSYFSRCGFMQDVAKPIVSQQ
ncbi:MAG: amino acid adenylation domain-containing protein [Cyanobacteria bacterium J06634_6]